MSDYRPHWSAAGPSLWSAEPPAGLLHPAAAPHGAPPLGPLTPLQDPAGRRWGAGGREEEEEGAAGGFPVRGTFYSLSKLQLQRDRLRTDWLLISLSDLQLSKDLRLQRRERTEELNSFRRQRVAAVHTWRQRDRTQVFHRIFHCSYIMKDFSQSTVSCSEVKVFWTLSNAANIVPNLSALIVMFGVEDPAGPPESSATQRSSDHI